MTASSTPAEELAALAALLGGVVTGVVETTVFGVPGWHAECSGCQGWRCHRACHEAEDTAVRCSQRHADRRHGDPAQ